MTKVNKTDFWKFLNSQFSHDDDYLFFRGKYKHGSERSLYFYREIPIGEKLATVGRRTQYFINLNIRKDLENE